MKRILKNVTIVCLCFILIGIGFTVCGRLLGGSFSFSYAPRTNKVITSKDIEYHTINEETEAFTSIDIQTDSKDIAIATGDAFSISYSEDTSENNTYSVENGILKVKSNTKGQFFFFNFDWDFVNNQKKDVLTITVPEGTNLDTLSLQSSSGDCSLSQQAFNEVSMNLYYGDIFIDNTTVKHADFNLTDGDFILKGSQIDNINAYLKYGECDIRNTTVADGTFILRDGDFDTEKFHSQTLELTLDYGDLSFFDGSIGTLTAKLSDGDCDMKVNDIKDNYNIALTAKDGDISIDGMEAEEYYNSTGSGGRAINITNKYGDITIQFQ